MPEALTGHGMRSQVIRKIVHEGHTPLNVSLTHLADPISDVDLGAPQAHGRFAALSQRGLLEAASEKWDLARSMTWEPQLSSFGDGRQSPWDSCLLRVLSQGHRVGKPSQKAN